MSCDYYILFKSTFVSFCLILWTSMSNLLLRQFTGDTCGPQVRWNWRPHLCGIRQYDKLKRGNIFVDENFVNMAIKGVTNKFGRGGGLKRGQISRGLFPDFCTRVCHKFQKALLRKKINSFSIFPPPSQIINGQPLRAKKDPVVRHFWGYKKGPFCKAKYQK